MAMIGLGRMGGNMVERLVKDGHTVVVYDPSAEAMKRVTRPGVTPARDLTDLCGKLTAPRVVWVMVPAGDPVDQTIAQLTPHLAKGDVIIDGGNSNFKDSMRLGATLARQGVEFIDAGTSGGVWGLENGYCLMVGGSKAAVKLCTPIFKTLAPPDGFAHVGPIGAGHYVKMVHNGIEYGLLQAYAEGYEVLHASKLFPDLDLAQIAELWQHASVVRSWLNELARDAFVQDGSLSSIRGWVADSGEGRWTVNEAMDLDVPTPVITLSLLMRFRSRQEDSFSAKVIAALRNQFGGHAVKSE
jgi:6-phosphogluconate dehydrogenase